MPDNVSRYIRLRSDLAELMQDAIRLNKERGMMHSHGLETHRLAEILAQRGDANVDVYLPNTEGMRSAAATILSAASEIVGKDDPRSKRFDSLCETILKVGHEKVDARKFGAAEDYLKLAYSADDVELPGSEDIEVSDDKASYEAALYEFRDNLEELHESLSQVHDSYLELDQSSARDTKGRISDVYWNLASQARSEAYAKGDRFLEMWSAHLNAWNRALKLWERALQSWKKESPSLKLESPVDDIVEGETAAEGAPETTALVAWQPEPTVSTYYPSEMQSWEISHIVPNGIQVDEWTRIDAGLADAMIGRVADEGFDPKAIKQLVNFLYFRADQLTREANTRFTIFMRDELSGAIDKAFLTDKPEVMADYWLAFARLGADIYLHDALEFISRLAGNHTGRMARMITPDRWQDESIAQVEKSLNRYFEGEGLYLRTGTDRDLMKKIVQVQVQVLSLDPSKRAGAYHKLISELRWMVPSSDDLISHVAYRLFLRGSLNNALNRAQGTVDVDAMRRDQWKEIARENNVALMGLEYEAYRRAGYVMGDGYSLSSKISERVSNIRSNLNVGEKDNPSDVFSSPGVVSKDRAKRVVNWLWEGGSKASSRPMTMKFLGDNYYAPVARQILSRVDQLDCNAIDEFAFQFSCDLKLIKAFKEENPDYVVVEDAAQVVWGMKRITEALKTIEYDWFEYDSEKMARALMPDEIISPDMMELHLQNHLNGLNLKYAHGENALRMLGRMEHLLLAARSDGAKVLATVGLTQMIKGVEEFENDPVAELTRLTILQDAVKKAREYPEYEPWLDDLRAELPRKIEDLKGKVVARGEKPWEPTPDPRSGGAAPNGVSGGGVSGGVGGAAAPRSSGNSAKAALPMARPMKAAGAHPAFGVTSYLRRAAM
jgi:hypothetical protein